MEELFVRTAIRRLIPMDLNIYMPKVGKKHFPYTKKGKAMAKKARAKLKK